MPCSPSFHGNERQEETRYKKQVFEKLEKVKHKLNFSPAFPETTTPRHECRAITEECPLM